MLGKRNIVAAIGVLALAERARPCRGDARPAWRQVANLTLVGVDTLLTRVLLPLAGIELAARLRAGDSGGIGLFAMLPWPEPIEIVAAALALDMVIYFQHRVLHRVPVLWRAHRVHHEQPSTAEEQHSVHRLLDCLHIFEAPAAAIPEPR